MNKNTGTHKLRTNSRKAVNLLKALAHQERLLILCQLANGEQNVGSLLQASKLSQSAFSQHLAVLRRHKLVTIRKASQTVYYSLANSNSLKIIQVLHELFCSPDPKK